jgi:hypothetical protein
MHAEAAQNCKVQKQNGFIPAALFGWFPTMPTVLPFILPKLIIIFLA